MTASVDANGQLTVSSILPGESFIVDNASNKQNGDVVQQNPINTAEAVEGKGQARLDELENQVEKLLVKADAKYLRITNTIDSSAPETKTLDDIQMNLLTLGLSDSPFGETEVDNGIVYVKQDDTRFAVGKVMLSSFVSESGLIPIGSNMYSASAQSGEAIYSNDISKISNNMLELSNSDLSEGLVDLMVYQRAFEANSKSITTSDEFLKTAIQLKK
jgi:flagellar hook protein FlgE